MLPPSHELDTCPNIYLLCSSISNFQKVEPHLGDALTHTQGRRVIASAVDLNWPWIYEHMCRSGCIAKVMERIIFDDDRFITYLISAQVGYECNGPLIMCMDHMTAYMVLKQSEETLHLNILMMINNHRKFKSLMHILAVVHPKCTLENSIFGIIMLDVDTIRF